MNIYNEKIVGNFNLDESPTILLQKGSSDYGVLQGVNDDYEEIKINVKTEDWFPYIAGIHIKGYDESFEQICEVKFYDTEAYLGANRIISISFKTGLAQSGGE